MADAKMIAQLTDGPGFIAALDQSGGSTPGALKLYGIAEDSYHGEDEMFRLMHAMRVRVITSPSFTGQKVIAAILFEQTMDGEADGRTVPGYLWQERGVVPLVKVDKGMEAEADGVTLMKPILGLDALLDRAAGLGVAGTKMRSAIRLPDERGIAAIAAQQFEIGDQIARHGLMPILEPEVLLKSPDRGAAEEILRTELRRGLDALPSDRQVMLKLTIPSVPDLYRELIEHPRCARVVALSGGYDRHAACVELAKNRGLIGSFSRALLEGLTAQMSDEEFDDTLAAAIDEIYAASVAP